MRDGRTPVYWYVVECLWRRPRSPRRGWGRSDEHTDEHTDGLMQQDHA